MEKEEILKMNDETINKTFDALVEKGKWSQLQDFGETLLQINERSFIGALSYVIGYLELGFIHDQDVYYKVHYEEMEYDFKTRLYFFARNKYRFANSKIKDRLHVLYPDSINEDGHKEKCPSFFEGRYKFICKQYEKMNTLKDTYLPILEQNAQGIRQTRFLRRYLDWYENISFARQELERYRDEVDACIQDDYKKTPSAGNGLKFFLNFLIFLIAAAVAFFCGGTFISQYQHIVPIEKLQISINVLAGITSGVILLYAFVICYIGQIRKKHPFIAVMIVLTAFLISSFGLAITLSKPAEKGNIYWYLLSGAILSVIIGIICLYSLFEYFPRRVNRHRTRMGDTDRLVNDTPRIEFQFHWKENPKTIENLTKKDK